MKKKNSTIVVMGTIILLLVTLTGCPTEIDSDEPISYAVGSVGPAGGYIFYDDEVGYDLDNDGTIEDDEKDLFDGNNDGEVTGDRYLEAAPSDILLGESDYNHIFGYYRPNGGIETTVGTATALGTGQANTTALITAMGTTAYTYFQAANDGTTTEEYAANLCNDYIVGDYDDWFLPSKDELKLIYVNLKNTNLVSFKATYYWSSSEFYSSLAWAQYFDTDVQNQNDRYDGTRVRPVKAF